MDAARIRSQQTRTSGVAIATVVEYCNLGEAAMLVLQRADDQILVPIYDMYSHNNGKYYNTETTNLEGEKFFMKANRDIEKGEQISNSYNQCNTCGGRVDDYGTAGKE